MPPFSWMNKKLDPLVLDATIGESACPTSNTLEHVKLSPAMPGAGSPTPIKSLVAEVEKKATERDEIERMHQDSNLPYSAETKATLDQLGREIKEAFEMVAVDVGVYPDMTRFYFSQVIGSGTFGSVAKFAADGTTGKGPLAVKVCPKCNIKGLPASIACNVVKTAVFNGGTLQVMEMGTDLRRVPVAPVTIAAFEQFCNTVALCLRQSNVAFPDWKLGNLTAFFNPCGGPTGWEFRVIDVDGLSDLDVFADGLFTCTFPCTAASTIYENRESVRIAANHALANTAFAIEVSKVLFATSKNIPAFNAEIEFLLDLRTLIEKEPKKKDSPNLSFDQIIEKFDEHGMRGGVHYPNVIELLTRLADCEGEWRWYDEVYQEWFHDQQQAETEPEPEPEPGMLGSARSWFYQKFVDLTQTRPR